MTKKRRRTWWLGLLACGGLLAACAHTKQAPLEPTAAQAVDQTRGTCPTDLEQTVALLDERPDGFALVFQTQDEAQRLTLHDRAKALGEALTDAHPAVNAQGTLVQHQALPAPELRERPTSSPGYAVELAIPVPAEQRDTVKSDLEEHLRLWRTGECPELTTPAPRDVARTDSRQTETPREQAADR